MAGEEFGQRPGPIKEGGQRAKLKPNVGWGPNFPAWVVGNWRGSPNGRLGKRLWPPKVLGGPQWIGFLRRAGPRGISKVQWAGINLGASLGPFFGKPQGGLGGGGPLGPRGGKREPLGGEHFGWVGPHGGEAKHRGGVPPWGEETSLKIRREYSQSAPCVVGAGQGAHKAPKNFPPGGPGAPRGAPQKTRGIFGRGTGAGATRGGDRGENTRGNFGAKEGNLL